MTTPSLLTSLRAEEALRLAAYQDTRGVWTIGYGHTGKEVHPGLTWTVAQAEAQFQLDLAATEAQLDHALPWWRKLDDVRQDCIADLGFNMGVHKLCGFDQFLRLMQGGLYKMAALDLSKTPWYTEVRSRGPRIVNLIRTGAY